MLSSTLPSIFLVDVSVRRIEFGSMILTALQCSVLIKFMTTVLYVFNFDAFPDLKILLKNTYVISGIIYKFYPSNIAFTMVLRILFFKFQDQVDGGYIIVSQYESRGWPFSDSRSRTFKFTFTFTYVLTFDRLRMHISPFVHKTFHFSAYPTDLIMLGSKASNGIVILAPDEDRLEKLLRIVESWCRRWNMNLNLSKTNIVHFRKRKGTKSRSLINSTLMIIILHSLINTNT